MLDQLKKIEAEALEDLKVLHDLQQLEAWRIKYLGKKSPLYQILRSLRTLPEEERRNTGASANQIRNRLTSLLSEKQNALRSQAVSKAEQGLDVTLPGRPVPIGRLHPTTQTIREICQIFSNLGFQVVEGPEVEWDYYNFEALNIPADHPARDMWATFWLDIQDEKEQSLQATRPSERKMLLRTHTSPMQIRIMEKTRPPIRVVVPGKVFRYEATDATHESMFYQIEGLAIDRNITMADLKGALYYFARRLFGSQRKVRFRCDYFPFVEPGVEMAIDCFACNGEGCRICGSSGWIEILGAGMVHPEVLRRVNYDPSEYTGFAFGLGVERIPMLRYGIEDIRLFYSNDFRFLKQF